MLSVVMSVITTDSLLSMMGVEPRGICLLMCVGLII